MRAPPAPFARTLRALESDRFERTWIGIGASAVLLAAWMAWAFAARITLYEPSRTARIEASATVHPLDARVEGRVIATKLELGRSVEAGEVLLEIDDRAAQIHLTEERARYEGLKPQLVALRAELAAAESAVAEGRTLGEAASAETRARARSVEVEARYAEDSAERSSKLAEGGLASAEESKKASAEARRLRSTLEASRFRQKRMELDRRAREADSRARVERLNKEIFDLESRIEIQGKTVERLQYELSEHKIRAPVSGRIADVVDLTPGAIVRAGMRVGSIVPDGALRIVAELAPHSALGRVKRGQAARMRLDSFPWLEYGMVRATVRSIASEPQRGTIRAELDIDRELPPAVMLQHGLLGSLEIAVEEVSPATLVLRVAGDMFRTREEPGDPSVAEGSTE